MRKSNLLIMAAMLGSTLLIFAGEFSPASARPRVTLSQCIGNYWSCVAGCYNPDSPLPPDYSVSVCHSNCWSNHAACVDLAFSSLAPASADRPAKPAKRPSGKKSPN
jgi:hypothetical protein